MSLGDGRASRRSVEWPDGVDLALDAVGDGVAEGGETAHSDEDRVSKVASPKAVKFWSRSDRWWVGRNSGGMDRV